MATKTKTNLLVGAKVIIDHPNQWRHAADEATRQRLRAETEASKNTIGGAYFFGEVGTVVNYQPGRDSGKEYDVLLDSSHEVETFHPAWFTVLEMPKPDGEVVAILAKILEAIQALDKNIVKAIKDGEPAL